MGIPFSVDRHDIGILRQNGTDYVGFMLYRDPKTNKPFFVQDDDEYLVKQQTQQTGYASLPYEKEIRMGQDSWDGGFGQEIYDADNPSKYTESQGVTTCYSHKAFLNGNISSLTIPTLPTIVDGGMEIWTEDSPQTVTLAPNGASVTTFGLVGAPTNWQACLTNDGDTSYVHFAGGSFDKDLYTSTDTAIHASVITSVAIKAVVKGENSGFAHAMTAVKTNGTAYNGTDSGILGVDYITLTTTYTVNPQTTNVWTWAEVNAMEIGVSLKGWPGVENAYCTQVYAVVTYYDVNLNNWTHNLGTQNSLLKKETSLKYVGSFSANLSQAGGGGNYARIYQDAGNINSIKGQYVSATCRVILHDSANYTASIAIQTDGTGGTTTYTYATYSDGTTWEWLRVGVTVPADATYCRFWCRAEDTGAGSGDAFFDNFSAGATYGNTAPYCKEPFNSNVYFALGQDLMKANSSGTVTLIRDMDYTITCLRAFTDGCLYIALDTSSPYYYMSTAEVFVESNAAVHHFKYFEQLDATSPTLYGSDSVNTIRSTIDPQNGGTAWSAVTTIDTAEWAITNLLCAKNQLYIIKGNRPYYLDSSGNVKTLTSMTDAVASTTGGVNSVEWQGRVYMPYGTQGLLEYDIADATFAWRQPSAYGYGAIGAIKALWGDDQFLYCLCNNGTTLDLFAGNITVNSDGSSGWAWNQLLHYAAFGTVLTAMITNYISSKKYLLIGVGATVQTIIIPSQYGDVTTDSTMLFWNSTTYMITPWLHGEFKEDKKAFLSLTLNMGHAYSASRYITAQYELWGDTSWTNINASPNFTGSATSMTETKYFLTTTKPSSTYIRFKFTFVTNTTASTPILNSYSCKAVLFPKRRNIYKMIIRVGDGIKDRMGQPLQGRKDLRDALVEAKDDATAPITWYDIFGNTKYGRILPTQPFLEQRTMEANQTSAGIASEELCYLNIQEVRYS